MAIRNAGHDLQCGGFMGCNYLWNWLYLFGHLNSGSLDLVGATAPRIGTMFPDYTSSSPGLYFAFKHAGIVWYNGIQNWFSFCWCCIDSSNFCQKVEQWSKLSSPKSCQKYRPHGWVGLHGNISLIVFPGSQNGVYYGSMGGLAAAAIATAEWGVCMW